MVTTKTSLNTTIPGQKGYKEVRKGDKIKNQQQFEWLYIGQE